MAKKSNLLKSVTASAPGKLMLTGSFAVVHGRPCVATAVDQRLTVKIQKNGEDVFYMEAPDLDLIKYSKTIADLGKKQLPKAVRFIELLYKRFLEQYPQPRGIVVTTSSDFSASVGFGSSSAVTVAFAKALTTLYNVKLNDWQLFDLCYQAVLDVQGVGSGYDLATAIWGGTLLYETPASRIEQIDLPSLPIVVGYTGIKADTPTLVRMVNAQYQKPNSKIPAVFDEIGHLSNDIEIALQKKDWDAAGKVLSAHHQAASKLGVSTTELDALTSAANQAGAFGASLSGAGGGDCMVALVDAKHRSQVEAAITAAGGQIIPVAINAPGVSIDDQEYFDRNATNQNSDSDQAHV